MISLKTHNVLDYVNGGSVAAFPLVFPNSKSETLKKMSVALGSGEIFYSAITRYPYSIAKVVPLGAHLIMDLMSGLSVAALPFVARARGEKVSPSEWGYCVGMGLAAFLNVALVEKKREDEEVIAEAFDHRITPALSWEPNPSKLSKVIEEDIEEMTADISSLSNL
jgi:hypothetical protein